MALLAVAWWGRENVLAREILRREAEQARKDQYVANREAARALARRGDWARALEFYDQALPAAGPARLSPAL